ncbi:MAG: hypothetical protein R3F30_05575 [Planctomycetota bacterium]
MTADRTRSPARLTAAAAALLALAAGPARLAAQGDDLPKWKIDPYTRMDPKAMERAGYVSFGPFGFGEINERAVPTDEIEKELGEPHILWVETAHFRLGSSLERWPIPVDRETRTKLRAELEELAEKLPRINERTRVLDPWLRVHLFAHRLEKLYADWQKRLGVTDASFPDKPNSSVDGKYMGEGRFLGQKEKYAVLLLQKESDYTRYLRTYIGMAQTFAKRHNFKMTDMLFFGTAAELYEGSLRHDTSMHCHVYFNVVQQLINGYRHYNFDFPVWFKEGVGHFYGRGVDEKYNNFDQNESTSADVRKTWNWKPKVRALVVAGSDKVTPWAEMFQWRDYGQITFTDHMVLWSRVEYLIGLGDDKFAKFLFAVKDAADPNRPGGRADVLDVQREAFRDAWGGNVVVLEEKWKEYVKTTYPVR